MGGYTMPNKKKIDSLPEAGEELELLEDAEEQEEEGFEDEALIGPDGKELLFPNGPTLELIEEWKSRFGDIYLTEFEEEVLIWRALTRKEYKNIMNVEKATNFYKEEKICEAVVIWPEKYNFLQMTNGKAGIPTLIAELVMEKSGFQAKTGALRL
jgi:hypothetical protein